MLTQIIEVGQSSRAKRIGYTTLVLFCLLVIALFTGLRLALIDIAPTARWMTDFDAFYLVGKMVWKGAATQAHYPEAMAAIQRSMAGEHHYLTWNYLPQFDLVVALLALLPVGAAYGVFIISSLFAYVVTLQRLAGTACVSVLLLMYLPMLGSVIVGQNGLLCGALTGLACLGFLRGKAWAGFPLGLMIIKPHFAVAFAVYTLVNRQWAAMLVATATVLASFLLVTLVLGFEIWPAFFAGAKGTTEFMTRGDFALFRMTSIYATLRTFGLSAGAALGAQIMVAVAALASVSFASLRFTRRQALGITAIASLLISPYAYDYDTAILGVGLALLLPDIMQQNRVGERSLLYALTLVGGGYGLARAARFTMLNVTIDKAAGGVPLSLAGPVLLAILALVLWIFTRKTSPLADLG